MKVTNKTKNPETVGICSICYGELFMFNNIIWMKVNMTPHIRSLNAFAVNVQTGQIGDFGINGENCQVIRYNGELIIEQARNEL